MAACLEALDANLEGWPETTAPDARSPDADAALLLRVLRSRKTPLAEDQIIQVAADGSWFRHPGGKAVSLGRRQAARLILKALAERATMGPAVPLSVHELFAHGWPGVSVDPEWAAKRVYTTIHDLRHLGLKEALVTRGDGYRFDRPVAIQPISQDA